MTKKWLVDQAVQEDTTRHCKRDCEEENSRNDARTETVSDCVQNFPVYECLYKSLQLKKSIFHEWQFGSINLRSGKEKDEGAKMYMVAKEVARANLAFCCLQEVKYRNSGKKLINLDSGEKFEFHWFRMKKRREAGVGILIRVDNNIVINDADFQTPRIMSFDLKIHGFNIRLVNVYAPTDCGGTVSSKDEFYRSLRKACKTNEKHQKLIVAGDFNAKTKVALSKCDYDSTTTMFDDDCNDNGIRL